LRLLKEGLGDKEVAARVGTTPNHVWAIRVTGPPAGFLVFAPRPFAVGRSDYPRYSGGIILIPASLSAA
jgi:hypothetical protein